MRPISFPATFVLLLGILPPTAGAEGDWPMWRHDPALTGYQPTPGAMAKGPHILARHFLGASPGTAIFADLLGSGRDAEVLVLAGARLTAYGADGKRHWESRPHGYILDPWNGLLTSTSVSVPLTEAVGPRSPESRAVHSLRALPTATTRAAEADAREGRVVTTRCKSSDQLLVGA